MYLTSDVGIDGEWYSHELAFSEIQGACMSSVNYNKNVEKIQLWIFDIIVAETSLEDRYSMLLKAYNSYIKDGHSNKYFVIIGKSEAKSHTDIINMHNTFVTMGYEGAIIRHPISSIINKRRKIDSYYRGKRNRGLIKVKAFDDDEFVVIDVLEGSGRDEGTAVFRLETKDGKPFNCRPTGSHELRTHWFQHQEECINRLYTVKFFGYTDDGIPRMPTGKDFRDSLKKKGVKTY